MKLVDYDGLQSQGIKYSRPHLWRLINAGKFPKPRTEPGSKRLWDQADIDAHFSRLTGDQAPAAA